jgi:hypothetical protein
MLPAPIERRLSLLETALHRWCTRPPAAILLREGETAHDARQRLGLTTPRPGDPPDIFVNIIRAPRRCAVRCNRKLTATCGAFRKSG